MKNLLARLLEIISYKVVGRKNTRKLLIELARAVDLDLLLTAHYDRGISNYFEISTVGEAEFLRRVVVPHLSSQQKQTPCLFDVGANTGQYTLMLHDLFPTASIHAFEPNPASYAELQKRAGSIEGVRCIPKAVGQTSGTAAIYTYRHQPESQHASMLPEVMTELQHTPDALRFDVEVLELDGYCCENNIDRIHFLKVDTEGYELDVFRGAARLLADEKIDIIQFEFNEMNVYAKAFLHDFYNLMPQYRFFRMDRHRLIDLGAYSVLNEVFRYQNIIAIHKNIFGTATANDWQKYIDLRYADVR